MDTILDYIAWRGDLDFSQDDFNEIDNLVLSMLAYLEFDEVVPEQKGARAIPLKEVAPKLIKPDTKDDTSLVKSLIDKLFKLLPLAAHSTRYGAMQLSHYVNQINFEQSEQFAAVTFSLSKRVHYIAFRGTDNTLAGWKEDLQMSYKDAVRAQKEAVRYSRQVMQDLPGKFYLGGHSKGGNLAVFAGAKLERRLQRRILHIYNNDGPGFQKKIITSQGYKNILKKTTTFLPKSSIVGMMLEHREGYKVVGSHENGIMQHEGFSWKVRGPRFVYEDGLSESSLKINRFFKDWLEQVPKEEQEEFVDALFEILHASGAEKMTELTHDMLNKSVAMINTYRNLEAETQTNLKNVLETLFNESQKAVKKTLSEKIGSLISDKLPKKKEEA